MTITAFGVWSHEAYSAQKGVLSVYMYMYVHVVILLICVHVVIYFFHAHTD